jgi:DNA-binding HxlR family transcriptional regulator
VLFRREVLDGIAARLARLDAASRRGPWTAAVLGLIGRRPAVRAAELAADLGIATEVLKRDVRKLKELGLTESLNPGYRLSPRGEAVLKRVGSRKKSGPSLPLP